MKKKKPAIYSRNAPAAVRDIRDEGQRVYTRAAGLALAIHAFLYLIWLLARSYIPSLARFGRESSLRAYVSGGILAQGLLVLLPVIITILVYKLTAAEISGGRPRAGSLIIGTVIGVPAAVVFQGLNNLLIYALVRGGLQLPDPTSSASFLTDEIYSYSWPILILIAIIGMILPGICEELFFRGVVQSAMISAGAAGAAVFWQAIAFALFHADPLFWLPPFLAGLMLGFIRLRSNSIFPAILAHISLNLSLLAVNPLLPRLTGQLIARSSSQATSLLYASLVAAFVAAVALVPLLVLVGQLRPEHKSPKRRTGLIRLFPFDWLFAAACLAIILLIIRDI